MRKDLSLYIHIPFCKSKCHYCDFLSFAQCDGDMKRYVDALASEIEAYGELCRDYVVKSIFIGGGTPSILEGEDIEKVMNVLWKHFDIDTDAEISVEANPGTLTEEKVATLVAVGVNRVSMGLQSCQNHLLKILGRIHTWDIFIESYNMLRDGGIHNINVDLMFGLPNQSIDDVQKDIEMIAGVNPEHVSYYGLIVEEGTRFYDLRKKNMLPVVNEEMEREMYWCIHEQLEQQGYEHYEISNYSKTGRACYHNKVYWEGKPYIGMGLGASSYFESQRYKNIDNMESYIVANEEIKSLKEDIVVVDEHMAIEEFMFLGLRLLMGVSKDNFINRFGRDINYYYGDVMNTLINQGLVEEDRRRIWLTDKGIDISNYVFAHFIMDK